MSLSKGRAGSSAWAGSDGRKGCQGPLGEFGKKFQQKACVCRQGKTHILEIKKKKNQEIQGCFCCNYDFTFLFTLNVFYGMFSDVVALCKAFYSYSSYGNNCFGSICVRKEIS